MIEILFLISLIPTWNNKAYAHISSAIPNVILKKKDGYNIAFLPYPAQPKVNDNSTLLNFNVQKNGNDITNTFILLIIMDKASKNSILSALQVSRICRYHFLIYFSKPI